MHNISIGRFDTKDSYIYIIVLPAKSPKSSTFVHMIDSTHANCILVTTAAFDEIYELQNLILPIDTF